MEMESYALDFKKEFFGCVCSSNHIYAIGCNICSFINGLFLWREYFFRDI